MIRTCPKCRAYYADDLLAFCLVDGMPLVNEDPLSESWREGSRVIKEKENALRKQQRKLKWRRFLLRAMTMLITIMVVCVVIVNSFIYLKPKQGEDDEPEPLTSTTAPGGPSAPVIPGQAGGTAPVPQPTVTPTPTASPTATKISTPTPIPSPTLSFTPTPTPQVCSDADQSREKETIVKSFGNVWRRNIEGERRKISPENAPQGFANSEASLIAIEYTSTFSKACMAGVITAKYMWQVKTNVNGTIKVVPVTKEKKFDCVKALGKWICR
jgi:hypothetical protein